MSTIFTKIIKGEIPSEIVYEDKICAAFLDISQATPGHLLVVPKKEYKNIFELNEKVGAHLMKVLIKLANAVKKAFSVEAVNIVNNSGAIAGQTVFHLHFHIIPRYGKEDGVVLKVQNNSDNVSSDELKKRAEKIRSAL